MLYEKVKINLNRLDYNLKELYSEVKITEKSTHNQFFFQIEATGRFENLLESSETREVKSLVFIEKNNLNFEEVKWSYSVDPTDSNADFIERISKIDELAQDIHNTVSKRQMDSSYLKKTPVLYELINENSTVIEEDPLEKEILRLVEKFDVTKDDLVTEKVLGKRHFKIYYKKMSISEKLKLETKLNNLDGISYISFIDDFIKVNLMD